MTRPSRMPPGRASRRLAGVLEGQPASSNYPRLETTTTQPARRRPCQPEDDLGRLNTTSSTRMRPSRRSPVPNHHGISARARRLGPARRGGRDRWSTPRCSDRDPRTWTGFLQLERLRVRFRWSIRRQVVPVWGCRFRSVRLPWTVADLRSGLRCRRPRTWSAAGPAGMWGRFIAKDVPADRTRVPVGYQAPRPAHHTRGVGPQLRVKVFPHPASPANRTRSSYLPNSMVISTELGEHTLRPEEPVIHSIGGATIQSRPFRAIVRKGKNFAADRP